MMWRVLPVNTSARTCQYHSMGVYRSPRLSISLRRFCAYDAALVADKAAAPPAGAVCDNLPSNAFAKREQAFIA
jgi:hypothetical protein